MGGCGDGAGRARTEVTVDTIDDVVHVRNPTGAPEWRAERFVRIGSLGDVTGDARPDEFGRIRAVAADRDGNIYVADVQTSEIRVFAPDGTFLRALGREGEGPGEMESAYGVGLVGDTVTALDPGNARINLYTRTGEDAGLVRWASLTGPASVVRFHPAGPGAVWFRGIQPAPGGGLSGWYGRLTPAGVADTVPEPENEDDGPPAAIVCRSERSIRSYSIPFVPRRLWIPMSDGLATAWSADYRVAFLDQARDTLRVVHRPFEPVPVTDADWSADGDMLRYARDVEQFGTSGCEPVSADRPATKPALIRLHADKEGRLVVERNVAGGTAFDLYDRDGRIRGTFRAPPHDPDVPPYFRDDRMYVVEEDSLEVEYVVAYQLIG